STYTLILHLSLFFFSQSRHHRHLHSFPTRRSSDLLQATFLVKDAMTLKDWTERFDNVVDSGLFHVFSDDDRRRYVEGLATVLKRSEEHTSELQSQSNLVCRLLLEKKKKENKKKDKT